MGRFRLRADFGKLFELPFIVGEFVDHNKFRAVIPIRVNPDELLERPSGRSTNFHMTVGKAVF